MNTNQINKRLKFLDCYQGAYPRDKLPDVQSLPAAVVINTDESTKPGEHWVCVYVNKTGFGHYFDSYGLPPLHRDIKNFLESSCTSGWSYSKELIQNVTSVTCGHYCVLYVLARCVDISHESFIKLFTSNTLLNDNIVLKLYKEVNK